MSAPIRRASVARRIALAIALVSAVALAGASAPLNATTSVPNPDAWLAKLKVPHRQLFDAPAPNGGIPLVHVMNYYNTWNKAYGVPDKDVGAVLTFYGTTTLHSLSDAMWAKYKLGEFLGASPRGATANPRTSAARRTRPATARCSLPARRGIIEEYPHRLT